MQRTAVSLVETVRAAIIFGGQEWLRRKKKKTRSRLLAQSRTQPQPPAAAGEKRPRTTRRPYYNRRPRRPQQPKEAATPIHIYPLGGLGEVGKNMTVYECNGDMIIVDCGLVFPDSEMYGVDMVIPDFTFVVQNKDSIKGLLITHGHEDHIGSIPVSAAEVRPARLRHPPDLRPDPRTSWRSSAWPARPSFVEITPASRRSSLAACHRGAHPCEPLHPGCRGLCHRQPRRHHHPDRRLQNRLHPAGLRV